MTFPSGFVPVVVTGTLWQNVQPATGTVTFDPDTELTDAGGAAVFEGSPVVAIIGQTAQGWSNGAVTTLTPRAGWFSVPLVPTDAAGLVPTGWKYRVTVSLDGANPYGGLFAVPYGSGAADLASILAS
jgi:hypothetical protein